MTVPFGTCLQLLGAVSLAAFLQGFVSALLRGRRRQIGFEQAAAAGRRAVREALRAPSVPAPGAGPCKHNLATETKARLVYLEDVNRYCLEVGCRCLDCGTRFAFLGMPAGLSPNAPMCSVGRFEARLPVVPDAHATSLLAGIEDRD